MSRHFTAFLAGLIFAAGLGVSGMTDANKIIAFLDLAGDWDPSMMFVMVGAIGVHLGLYRLILKRRSPLFAVQFDIPSRRGIDGRLIGGSILFGLGWGMSGFCPGPGLVSLPSLARPVIVFVASMLAGMIVHKRVRGRAQSGSRGAVSS